MNPHILSLPLAFDARAIEKRVGLILLATDHSTEADFARLVAGPRIGLFATRVEYANPVTPENLRRMEPRLGAAAALLLPDESLDAICFSCTSASVAIGDAAVEAAITAAKPEVPIITPPDAAARALTQFGARRISLLTPYTVETTAGMANYFEARGFDLASVTCLGLEDDREMARIAPASLVEAAVAATDRQAEALFVSCTALRSAMIASNVEARIGRPVVTSNQATAWACLGLCGVAPALRLNAGRLFDLPFGQAA
ncbi:ectoine utilization protein EutA [Aureimonas endophytica]|uniref:Ectoine utilization protein EutA n=1 Tax=Aureimonas endophytica TaxID=2027858 RepID=A0A916ZLG0_9HYPH|nr:ectoine utilization protein EutA [Aureimonas endophytica]GGE03107.1 ectoine utilization protein EutA [Aureimonas endophytica]